MSILYVFVCVCMCVYIYIHIHMYTWLVHPCQVCSYFSASAQTYDCLCQWVHTIVFISCYLFRSLYIFCTACRILAPRLMFFCFTYDSKSSLSYLFRTPTISISIPIRPTICNVFLCSLRCIPNQWMYANKSRLSKIHLDGYNTKRGTANGPI